MTIPDTQLEVWAKQGANAGSRDTYAQIKNVLESLSAPYASQNFKVFLQGSYGNDTNIRTESDVDIVIQLLTSFRHNIESLPADQQAAFKQAFPSSGAYGLAAFKRDVTNHLAAYFGLDMSSGKRAINIAPCGSRRSADVIICQGYHRYDYFHSPQIQKSTSGIHFIDSSGASIVNYPKIHSDNCTAKHQVTNGWFKPTVRIFKNIRGVLIGCDALSEGDAPSYFLEGMIWNVPNSNFGGTYQETIRNCLVWLNNCDKSQLICANQQYKLLHPVSPVTWRAEKIIKFLTAAINFWNYWRGGFRL